MEDKVKEILRSALCDYADHWASDTINKGTREEIVNKYAKAICQLFESNQPPKRE